MFINTENTLYVTIDSLGELLVWSDGNNTLERHITINSSNLFGVFATTNGDIYFANGLPRRAIYRLFVDINNTLYCSQDTEHQVIKKSLEISSNNVTIVAGNGSNGSTSYLLDDPQGIFVDTKFNLYVADYGNDRIQFFPSNELNGTTVAGTGAPTTITLDGPTSKHTTVENTPTSRSTIVTASPVDTELITSSSFAISTSTLLTTSQIIFISATNSLASTTISVQNGVQPSSLFLPSLCSIPWLMGVNCSLSALLCDILVPCHNNGTCANENTTLRGYKCNCAPGFSGVCNQTSNTTFSCICASDWQEDHCQTKIDYCGNITCYNNGICESLTLNYTCRCIGESYSGIHCEIT
ncbi:hypothetical protein I4U23_012285 [Adineta vaga]|nr:hypothetical protein I4U23_012285 [Adineta vaga]